MSLDNLHKRIDKMLTHVEQQLLEQQTGRQSLEETLSLHLFTEREQVLFRMFLESLESRVDVTGHLDLRSLSDEELEKLHLWLCLSDALGSGDTAAAEKHRRYLKQDINSLVSAFLAIPEQSIPASFDQALRVNQDGVTYTLSSVSYRSAQWQLENALTHNRLGSVIDTMRMWVESFPATAA